MPANARTLIAWDSMVVLDCLEKRAGRYEFIRPIIKQAEAGELMVVVSTLAQTETQRIDGCEPADEIRIIDEFFDREWVHPEDTSSVIAKIARSLCRDHDIANLDAVHVATAVSTNCRAFLTNDGVAKKKRQPLLPLDNKIRLLDGTSLRIMTPEQYHQMGALNQATLFTQPKPDAKA